MRSSWRDITPDEARRIAGGRTWLAVLPAGLMIAALVVAPWLMYVAGSAWPGLAAVVFVGALGLGFRWWLTHRLRAVRAEASPTQGVPDDGQRPAG